MREEASRGASEAAAVKVLIAGGGTAGHVYPAIALATRLRDDHDAEVRFVGTGRGQEADLVPGAGFQLSQIDARPFRRSLSLSTLKLPGAFLRAVGQCRPLVAPADVVVGMGGYASGPAVLAAMRAGRPVVLHEQNAVPGLANRLFARRAEIVALSFEEAARRFSQRVRTAITGNPVREEIVALRDHRAALRKEGEAELELLPDRTTVVIFGGSQGALHLNRAAVGAFRRLSDEDGLQILLLAGRSHAEAVGHDAEPYGSGVGLLVRSRAFLDRMELAYAAADVVVARAGATSIAEISVAGLPSLLVPYPYATANHQEANARALQRAGAAEVMLDAEMTAASLASRITAMTKDRPALASMGEAAASWGKPRAAEAFSEVVVASAESGE